MKIDLHTPARRCIAGSARTATLMLTCLLLAAQAASAQFRAVHVPEQLHTSQDVNLYFDFDGEDPVDAAVVAVPSDWTISRVTLLDTGGRASDVIFNALPQPPGRYLLTPSRRLSRSDRLIIELKTGTLTGTLGLRITPVRVTAAGFGSGLQALNGFSRRTEFELEEGRVSPSNRVLQIEPPRIFVPASVKVHISGDAAFTAEMWFRTSARNAVLLSTWDGTDRTSYPLELLLDAGGRVVFFRGMPGEHRSMRGIEPVSDGTWHHVAVSHDPDSRWSRLLIDGTAVDSIFSASPLQIADVDRVVIGDRPARTNSGASALESSPFTGFLDEIRFWTAARSEAEIRRDMRRPMTPSNERKVLSFESADPAYSWMEPGAGRTSVASDLSFYEPIRSFDVRLDPASVRLGWEAPDPNVEAFVVERSDDGMAFSAISTIGRSSPSRFDGGVRRYEYRDDEVRSGVTYYRIRQVFSDGMETVSRSLKVGMGNVPDEEQDALLNNYPNPFNPATTITYQLREDQHVQVSVWDLSGQLVAVLVDENQEAGEHQVPFEARDLPSGTYFVRMRTLEGVRSHQIILTK
jgi:hypothetical protein